MFLLLFLLCVSKFHNCLIHFVSADGQSEGGNWQAHSGDVGTMTFSTCCCCGSFRITILVCVVIILILGRTTGGERRLACRSGLRRTCLSSSLQALEKKLQRERGITQELRKQLLEREEELETLSTTLQQVRHFQNHPQRDSEDFFILSGADEPWS